ncbi:hypothetical protein QT327_04655 [Olivibacter sp. 47]|uniref:hypothetical protein n=1 Tax=Olivibacter sp. 47 TaxID=3056486 RepID=UPI0025A3C67A|nr:hypothetical protein [Olivibacter sp. 47]MDM8173657.1 hypothetical protein [Olivibacter sp. 47]
MIKAIHYDDGYVIFRVASIGRGAIELLEQLQTDDQEDQILINQTITELSEVSAIEQRYYDDEQYKKWIRKEARHGNINIFMDAINCVEGALDGFMSKL